MKEIMIPEKQKIINTANNNDTDVIASAQEGAVAYVEVFFIRKGNVTGREHYRIDNVEGADSKEIITDFKKIYTSTTFDESNIRYPKSGLDQFQTGKRYNHS